MSYWSSAGGSSINLGAIAGDMIPSANNTHDLGSLSFFWDYTFSRYLARAGDGAIVIRVSDQQLTSGASVMVDWSGATVSLPYGFNMYDQNISSQVTIKGYNGTGSNYTLRMPSAQAASAAALVNDASGNLSWVAYTNAATNSAIVARDSSGNIEVNSVKVSANYRTAAGAEATGSGSAALGSNSPAVTNSAPFTWIKVLTSDGSTAYIPCWK